MLEAHSERVYGSNTEDSSESDSDSSIKESSPPQPTAQAVPTDLESVVDADHEGISIHEQHERFMEKQIQLATSYREKQERTISSKRSATTQDSEDFMLGKKGKFSSEVEKAVEQESEVQKKGPRTVSRAEKNKRRKLKKKKRLARKS